MNAMMVLRVALKALRVNKLRSSLTMLGMIIGVAAVIAMLAIGGGAQERVRDQLKNLGSNLMLIIPGSTTASGVRLGTGAAQTLTNDELYAITAYVFFLNDIVTSDDFELSDKNFRTIKLPNERNFFDDDREVAEKAFWRKDPCMINCGAGAAAVTGRARVIDVTPEPGKEPKVE